jgi:hypothetical protein
LEPNESCERSVVVVAEAPARALLRVATCGGGGGCEKLALVIEEDDGVVRLAASSASAKR